MFEYKFFSGLRFSPGLIYNISEVWRSGAGVANLIEISANNSSAKKHGVRTNNLL
jgi:hypothetical protein